MTLTLITLAITAVFIFCVANIIVRQRHRIAHLERDQADLCKKLYDALNTERWLRRRLAEKAMEIQTIRESLRKPA